MRDNFGAVMAQIFKHEGGYVDHPRDPGGATNMGITHATLSAYRGKKVTKADVKALTRAEAEAIYRKNYWNAVGGDRLHAGVDLAVMDYGVNSGPSRAAKALQRALGFTGTLVDGKVGPRTIQGQAGHNPITVVKTVCRGRLSWLKGLGTWKTFGKGWSRRVAEVEAAGVAMATKASTIMQSSVTEVLEIEADRAKSEAKGAKVLGGSSAAAGLGTGAGAIADVPMADPTAMGIAAAVLGVVFLFFSSRGSHAAERARAYAAQANLSKRGDI